MASYAAVARRPAPPPASKTYLHPTPQAPAAPLHEYNNYKGMIKYLPKKHKGKPIFQDSKKNEACGHPVVVICVKRMGNDESATVLGITSVGEYGNSGNEHHYKYCPLYPAKNKNDDPPTLYLEENKQLPKQPSFVNAAEQMDVPLNALRTFRPCGGRAFEAKLRRDSYKKLLEFSAKLASILSSSLRHSRRVRNPSTALPSPYVALNSTAGIDMRSSATRIHSLSALPLSSFRISGPDLSVCCRALEPNWEYGGTHTFNTSSLISDIFTFSSGTPDGLIMDDVGSSSPTHGLADPESGGYIAPTAWSAEDGGDGKHHTISTVVRKAKSFWKRLIHALQ